MSLFRSLSPKMSCSRSLSWKVSHSQSLSLKAYLSLSTLDDDASNALPSTNCCPSLLIPVLYVCTLSPLPGWWSLEPPVRQLQAGQLLYQWLVLKEMNNSSFLKLSPCNILMVINAYTTLYTWEFSSPATCSGETGTADISMGLQLVNVVKVVGLEYRSAIQ